MAPQFKENAPSPSLNKTVGLKIIVGKGIRRRARVKKITCSIVTLPHLSFSDYSKCGERKRIRLSRMVGGVISTHGMWPWQAGLYRIDQTTGEICNDA